MRKVLNQKEAAEYLGMKAEHLKTMRRLGIGPAFLEVDLGWKSGRTHIAYPVEALDEWVVSQTVQPQEDLEARYLNQVGG